MIEAVSETRTDVLVLGGGIAAHRAALAAREAGASTTMVWRGHGASPYVIGFNAPLSQMASGDTPQIYFDDMTKGGCGLNDRRLVSLLAHNASSAYSDLRAMGVSFASDGDRTLQRHLSGNSHARSVYVPQGTGRALLQALSRRTRELGVVLRGGMTVIGLACENGSVFGALLWRPHTEELIFVHAATVVIAMGGIGRLYAGSTYPIDVAGDGAALAYEAGATLIDMEFVQFEPVVTIWPQECAGMEMPTAMLGDGAQLRNVTGERFMQRYNPPHGERLIEKASMALCIQREIDEGRGLPEGGVWFDATMLDQEKLESYVSHCARLRAAGVDPAVQPVIVAPAAHSTMGGILIDECGWTGVPGLYAAGEAAASVHGASRIAGNGCSDTLVLGAIAGHHAALAVPSRRHMAQPLNREALLAPLMRWNSDAARNTTELKLAIQNTLACHAGIWRDATGLRTGLAKIHLVEKCLGDMRASTIAGALDLMQIERMARSARMILTAALTRTESRGAHQRTDYPQTDADWLRHLSFQQARDNGAATPFDTPIH